MTTQKPGKLVGNFIRQKREALGLSQRALGLLFQPPVTTQFISNVERGVTPLPPVHIPTLGRALRTSEAEILALLEREYSAKISGKLGAPGAEGATNSESRPPFVVSENDYPFMRTLYDAYQNADDQTRQAFATVCESMLKLPKSDK